MSLNSVRIRKPERYDVEQVACVAGLCGLASLPLVLSVALLMWGA